MTHFRRITEGECAAPRHCDYDPDRNECALDACNLREWPAFQCDRCGEDKPLEELHNLGGRRGIDWCEDCNDAQKEANDYGN